MSVISEISALLIVIVMHEAAHWVCAALCKIPVRGFFARAGGMRMQLTRMPDYPTEWLICAAGPGINLACAFCLLGMRGMHPFGDLLLRFSLQTAVLNLLPIEGMDGGRMLFCAVAFRCRLLVAERVLRIASFACLFLLWLFSMYAVLRTASALSAALFSCVLFLHIFAQNQR